MRPAGGSVPGARARGPGLAYRVGADAGAAKRRASDWSRAGGAGRTDGGGGPVTKCCPAHPAATTCSHVPPGAGPEADSPPPPARED